MWEVTITDRGLGSSKKLCGQYCVGLTSDGIQLINKRNNKETYDLPVSVLSSRLSVRRFTRGVSA